MIAARRIFALVFEQCRATMDSVAGFRFLEEGDVKTPPVLGFLLSCTLTIAVLVAILVGRSARAQSPSTGPADSSNPATPRDDLQRSYRTDHYDEVAASGPARGENIYWHKCWVCHNKYQQAAPKLEGLFNLTTLVTGGRRQRRYGDFAN
jgi:hypothetical protein